MVESQCWVVWGQVLPCWTTCLSLVWYWLNGIVNVSPLTSLHKKNTGPACDGETPFQPCNHSYSPAHHWDSGVSIFLSWLELHISGCPVVPGAEQECWSFVWFSKCSELSVTARSPLEWRDGISEVRISDLFSFGLAVRLWLLFHKGMPLNYLCLPDKDTRQLEISWKVC